MIRQLLYVKLAGEYLLGREPMRHEFEFLPDDIFLVSYPKSGNTWLRFLIGNLVHQGREPVTFANLERMVPDVHRNSNQKLLRVPRPRIMKSHFAFDHRYQRVIYIARDPRDIVLSYYHYHIKTNRIGEAHSLEAYAEGFVTGELDPYGTWGDHAGSWLGARRDSTRFLLLRYEDLLADTAGELAKAAEFLEVDSSVDHVNRAIEASTADRMRRLERDENWSPTSGRVRSDVPFVRKAKSGQWREELPEAAARRIEAAWSRPMRELGYLES